MMETQSQVVAHAQRVHQNLWSKGNHVGTQTRSAIAVCRAWQAAVIEQFQGRFVAEHGLGGTDASQKIDLVDTQARIAYELKASPNNPHMEFYRDVFKILVFNRRNPRNPLRKLVFIAPMKGVVQLGTAFPADVQAIALMLDLQVEVAGI